MGSGSSMNMQGDDSYSHVVTNYILGDQHFQTLICLLFMEA